ncbi:MAG: phosphopantothenoylcysteine decarboxylase [Candidatus Brocadiia bacterium]
MRLLVAAGPTREYIDDVRFLSNASSGRMGCAIAQAAANRGHQVLLVCGPLEVGAPDVDVRPVVSTQEMLEAVCQAFPHVDAVVMAAAPADFRPARRAPQKIKKGKGPLTLELVPTADILKELARRREQQVLVGFALESEQLVERARAKLQEKQLDLVVANRPEAIGAPRATVHLLHRDGTEERLEDEEKSGIADRLVAVLERLVEARRRNP